MDISQYESAKVITCIVAKNDALPLANALNEKGHTKVNINYARRMEADTHNKLFSGDEVEILTLIESGSKADEVFKFIYDFLGIDMRPGSGFIYQTSLQFSSSFDLPQISSVLEENPK